MVLICKELVTIKYKWFRLGLHIGIPYDRLKGFREEENPLLALFNYRLKAKTSFLTWSDIVAALMSKDIGEIQLSKEICRRYCQQDLGDLKYHTLRMLIILYILMLHWRNKWVLIISKSVLKLVKLGFTYPMGR